MLFEPKAINVAKILQNNLAIYFDDFVSSRHMIVLYVHFMRLKASPIAVKTVLICVSLFL